LVIRVAFKEDDGFESGLVQARDLMKEAFVLPDDRLGKVYGGFAFNGEISRHHIIADHKHCDLYFKITHRAEQSLLAAINSATQFTDTPPLSATLWQAPLLSGKTIL
jgi:hypothetical protein